MTWVKFDDHFDEHEKVVPLGDAAFRAYVEGMCYCSRNLTDGRISAAKLKRMVRARTVDELVTAGLWHRNGDGVVVHDYLEYQPSAQRIREKRAADSERNRSGFQRSRTRTPREG